MAASSDWKESIVNYFNPEIPTVEKDWKRVAKGTLPNGETYREFHNAKVNRSVYTLGDDGDDCYAILEKDDWIYGIWTDNGTDPLSGYGGTGDISISFESKSRWERQRHSYDQHQQHLLEAFFPDFPELEEVTENTFVFQDSDYDALSIHLALKKAGFTHSQEITDWMTNHTAPPVIQNAPATLVAPLVFPATSAPAPVVPPKPTPIVSSFDMKVDIGDFPDIANLNVFYQDAVVATLKRGAIPSRADRLMTKDGEWGGDRYEIDDGHLWLAIDGICHDVVTEFFEYFVSMAEKNPDIKLMIQGDEGLSESTNILLFNQGFGPSNDPGGHWTNNPNGGNPPVPTPTSDYHGSGLATDGTPKASEFLALVGLDDEDVVIKITPLIAFARGDNFLNWVSPIVGHLLPSDWVETEPLTFKPADLCVVESFEFILNAGFTVDWPAFKKVYRNSLELYDVTFQQHKTNLDAVRNPVISTPQHHINPIAQGPVNSNYPELSGQLPEIQEALERARSQGVRGLEQENHNWLDLDEIHNKVDNDWYIHHTDGHIELERSHALWLLYEQYDNGSGLAFQNFFGMDNVRLEQELAKICKFEAYSVNDPDIEDEDYDEEAHHFEVTEDERDYPAPYDMEVPEYVGPPVTIHAPQVQTSKPAPVMQKPSRTYHPSLGGTITGGGSFAPVTAGPQTKPEDDRPAFATRIPFDAGEQPEEFLEALWKHWSDKGIGPVEWSNRWRPRYALILGLGYKFDRIDFTGIRIKMGYLNDKMEFLEELEIPESVYEGLFPDGGEWNDGLYQFINAGINPETGLTYSAHSLWDKVEPVLKAAGWMAAK